MAARVAVVGRYTATDANPETDWRYRAVGFPDRAAAEAWLERDDPDRLWWSDDTAVVEIEAG